MDMEQNVPSLSQAQRIKKLSQDRNCTIEKICIAMECDVSDILEITNENEK